MLKLTLLPTGETVTIFMFLGGASILKTWRPACRGMQETPVPDSCSLRLLVITGEIIDSRTLAIFFFGSLKVLNLIVSSLCTYPALNLEQKAEKALIPFPGAVQLPTPAKDIACRESFLVNWEFWITASLLVHTYS